MFLYKVSFPIVYNLCPALEFEFGPSKEKKKILYFWYFWFKTA